MNAETKPDLTRMLGVWMERGHVGETGRVAIISSVDEEGECLDGTEPLPLGSAWEADGTDADAAEFDLTEKLGDLDDLRRGADVLMQRREYVTAAVVYQLLGDEEGVERAVRLRREEIERERAEDEAKPF